MYDSKVYDNYWSQSIGSNHKDCFKPQSKGKTQWINAPFNNLDNKQSIMDALTCLIQAHEYQRSNFGAKMNEQGYESREQSYSQMAVGKYFSVFVLIGARLINKCDKRSSEPTHLNDVLQLAVLQFHALLFFWGFWFFIFFRRFSFA